MKNLNSLKLKIALIGGLWCGLAGTPLPAASVGTAFTYQGYLGNSGVAANGAHDLRFGLFAVSAGGVAVVAITNFNVAVSNGLFSAVLDFGGTAFNGTAYWLEIGVRTNGGGAFTALSPRQAITPAPYSVYASAAAVTDGSITTAKILDGTIATADFGNGVVTSNVLADNSVTSVKIQDGAVTANDLAADCVNSNKIADGGIATMDLATNAVTSAKILDGTIITADIALNAVTSNILADNSVTALKIVDGAVTASALASNSVSSSKISDGSIAAVDIALGAVNSAKILDASIAGVDIADNVVGSDQLADTIALGATNATGQLDIYRTSGNTPAISLVGLTSQINLYGGAGLDKAHLVGSSYGFLYLFDSTTNYNTGAELSANSASGGYLKLNSTNGTARAYLWGGNAGGLLNLYQADGGMSIVADGDVSGYGQITVRNTNSTATVDISGQGSASIGGRIQLKQNSGTLGLSLEGEEGAGDGGQIQVYNRDGALRVEIDGDYANNAGTINLYSADGGNSISLFGDSGGAGYVSVKNTNAATRIVLDGLSTAGGGEISVYDTDGTETVEILGAENSNEGGQIILRSATNITTVQIDGDVAGTGGGYIRLYKKDGTAAITLQADYNGDGRITTQEIQITGGSDLSEQFDITSVSAPPQPGMVVCIDPANPGQLLPSARAYDRTVAGVISGAGGVKPGMLMGQHGTKADGKHPVALTGRVFCLVDTANGAVQPGDLLTTSATPGHAMKATDHQRAQGAIIGKAMTALEKGQGLVLVLVSLQ